MLNYQRVNMPFGATNCRAARSNSVPVPVQDPSMREYWGSQFALDKYAGTNGDTYIWSAGCNSGSLQIDEPNGASYSHIHMMSYGTWTVWTISNIQKHIKYILHSSCVFRECRWLISPNKSAELDPGFGVAVRNDMNEPSVFNGPEAWVGRFIPPPSKTL